MKYKKLSRQRKRINAGENGNVFFFILLGIVLFAALAFTISRGMQSQTTRTLTKREVELAADDILNQAQKIARAVDRVRRNNCAEDDISFSNAIVSGYAHSPAVTDSCKVFSGAGGKMSYTAPDGDWLDDAQSAQSLYGQWLFTGTAAVNDVASTGYELLLILPYLKKDVCLQLNKNLDIADSGGSPPQDVGTAYVTTKYVGTFNGTHEIRDSGGSDELVGKEAGCFEGGGTPATGSYHFYYALIAR